LPARNLALNGLKLPFGRWRLGYLSYDSAADWKPFRPLAFG